MTSPNTVLTLMAIVVFAAIVGVGLGKLAAKWALIGIATAIGIITISTYI
jgi:hypothetical protein